LTNLFKLILGILGFALQGESNTGDGKPGPAATSQCDSPANAEATAPQQYGSFSIMASGKPSIPGTYGTFESALRSASSPGAEREA
jgi:hypothetical protein